MLALATTSGPIQMKGDQSWSFCKYIFNSTKNEWKRWCNDNIWILWLPWDIIATCWCEKARMVVGVQAAPTHSPRPRKIRSHDCSVLSAHPHNTLNNHYPPFHGLSTHLALKFAPFKSKFGLENKNVALLLGKGAEQTICKKSGLLTNGFFFSAPFPLGTFDAGTINLLVKD